MDQKPEVKDLVLWLKDLVDWVEFAEQLPGIRQAHIQLIKAQNRGKINDEKRELFIKWLAVYPEASYNDVVNALKEAEEMELAKKIIAKVTGKSEGGVATPAVDNVVKVLEKAGAAGIESTDSSPYQNDPPTIKDPKIPEPPDDVSEFCLEIAEIDKKIEERVKTIAELTEEEKEIKCILLTANKKEYRAVMSAAIAQLGDKEKYFRVMSNDGSATCVIVKYGQYNAAVMRTGQGTDPTRENLTKIQEIIKAPYVIAIGICYGLQPDKSELGDIIIGKSIHDISHTHATEEGTKFISKEGYFGEKLHSIFKRQDTFSVTPKATVTIHHEPGDCLVTETTRVTDQKRKDDILAKIPQALGGEMEAAGIFQAANEGAHKFDEWIVVKAIADWGDKKKPECKPWKKFSAVAAAKYVEQQLKMYKLEK